MAIFLRNHRGTNLSLHIQLGKKRQCYNIAPQGLDLTRANIASTMMEAKRLLEGSPDGAIYLAKGAITLFDSEAEAKLEQARKDEAAVAAMMAQSAANVAAAGQPRVDVPVVKLGDASTGHLSSPEKQAKILALLEAAKTPLDEFYDRAAAEIAAVEDAKALAMIDEAVKKLEEAPNAVSSAPALASAPEPAPTASPSKLTPAQRAAGPSMDWDDSDLRLEAAKMGIVVTDDMSKAGVVRKLLQAKK